MKETATLKKKKDTLNICFYKSFIYNWNFTANITIDSNTFLLGEATWGAFVLCTGCMSPQSVMVRGLWSSYQRGSDTENSTVHHNQREGRGGERKTLYGRKATIRNQVVCILLECFNKRVEGRRCVWNNNHFVRVIWTKKSYLLWHFITFTSTFYRQTVSLAD